MTISTETTAPLFVVVGSTGTLGGSVIKALRTSSRDYRIRAICRDANKPAAKELAAAGIEVVTADLSTAEGARKAFKEADIMFGLTVTNYSLSTPQEMQEDEFKGGKAQMDAAAEAGVKTVIWSGLTNHKKLSKCGQPISTFDSKEVVTEYARSLNKFALLDVQPAGFASNYWTTMAPRPIGNDVYAMFAPFAPETLVPVCDMEQDYGRYVVAALEQDGKGLQTVYTGRYISHSEIMSTVAKVSGNDVQFIPSDPKTFEENLSAAVGPVQAFCITEMFLGIAKNGYYCGEDVEPSLKLVGGIRSFEDTLIANKEKVMAAFA